MTIKNSEDKLNVAYNNYRENPTPATKNAFNLAKKSYTLYYTAKYKGRFNDQVHLLANQYQAHNPGVQTFKDFLVSLKFETLTKESTVELTEA